MLAQLNALLWANHLLLSDRSRCCSRRGPDAWPLRALTDRQTLPGNIFAREKLSESTRKRAPYRLFYSHSRQFFPLSPRPEKLFCRICRFF